MAVAAGLKASASLKWVNLSSNCLGDGETNFVDAAAVEAVAEEGGAEGGEAGGGGQGDGEGGGAPSASGPSPPPPPVSEGARVRYQGREMLVSYAGTGELKLRPVQRSLDGCVEIARAVLASRSLTAVDLAENQLGAEGGKAIAQAFTESVKGSPLATLDLRENYLEEAEEQVRAAVAAWGSAVEVYL